MTIIQTKDLCKRYGDNVVLNGISFSVEVGEIFGILGPSGSGKTTLVKTLMGHVLAERGESCLFGVSSRELRDYELNQIGSVMDRSGLFDRLTCYQNLDIFRRIHNVPLNAVEDCLEMVGLINSKDKAVNELSKGMKQRLVLARALVHNPKLLILDEPTSGLDPKTTNEIHQLLINLKKGGVTMLIVTHNMEEAHTLCDTVAFLFDGTFVECGSPDLICEKYNNNKDFVLNFKNGSIKTYKDTLANRTLIASLFINQDVISVNTTHVTLGDVFVNITGRKLDI